MHAGLHNHTNFADGAASAEDMVRAAIEKGCTAIGFSEHSETPFDPPGGMKSGAFSSYRDEILRLKEKYRGKIEIFLGIEQDIFSPPADRTNLDFVIGSVHYVSENGEYFSVDESVESFERNAKQGFGGDVHAFAEAYYDTLSRIFDVTRCNIVGHFDLITKFNERLPLIDEQSPRYRAAALRALDALCKTGAIFEINTGATARGYRTAPYPAPWLLRAMRERGARITLSADAHSTDGICAHFSQAKRLAKACGYQTAAEFRNGRFVDVPL